MKTPADFSAYLFDLDGTVYLGPDLIPGADSAIASLRAAGRRVMFLSNKPISTRTEYAEKLCGLGIPTVEADVLNSSGAMADYLGREMPGARAYVIGEEPLIQDLTAAGLRLVDDPAQTDVVVVSWDRGFTYAKLDAALHALQKGARLVATNPDVTCPVAGNDFVPDCGSLAAAVEAVSGRKIEVWGGKPSPVLATLTLTRLGLKAEACLMVGDRLDTDIAFGCSNGMGSALVLTGAGALTPLDQSPVKPDFVLQSIADLTLP
jgi:arabinose operon protein AraL